MATRLDTCYRMEHCRALIHSMRAVLVEVGPLEESNVELKMGE